MHTQICVCMHVYVCVQEHHRMVPLGRWWLWWWRRTCKFLAWLMLQLPPLDRKGAGPWEVLLHCACIKWKNWEARPAHGTWDKHSVCCDSSLRVQLLHSLIWGKELTFAHRQLCWLEIFYNKCTPWVDELEDTQGRLYSMLKRPSSKLLVVIQSPRWPHS